VMRNPVTIGLVTRGPHVPSRKCPWLCLYKTEVDEAKVGETKVGEELFQFSAAFGSARHSAGGYPALHTEFRPTL
jgi:hypothetical protein